eukprot:2304978-Rhodomonas_salina.1
MGAQYQPIETGLIPLDSVLISKGDFQTSAATLATRSHSCLQYDDASFQDKDVFDSRFYDDQSGRQSCAPNAVMCSSPATVPDQFVAFNIPLGLDWLPAASNDLSANVFVSLVVSAIDEDQIAVSGGTPNQGNDPEQMKTTLSASIPVVAGGVNIFCDQITAKTDLKDVVNVDIVVGSAGVEAEISRLRILEDIASTDLVPEAPSVIDTDSIEAALMTL